MVALTSWKLSQIENTLKSTDPSQILGIEARLRVLPDKDVLEKIEESLLGGQS